MGLIWMYFVDQCSENIEETFHHRSPTIQSDAVCQFRSSGLRFSLKQRKEANPEIGNQTSKSRTSSVIQLLG